MTDKPKKEVRGFLVTGCIDCAFAKYYDTEYGGIEYYFCSLFGREFENPDWDTRYMSGTRNEIPKDFPKFCRLTKVDGEVEKLVTKYNSVTDLVKKISKVMDDE